MLEQFQCWFEVNDYVAEFLYGFESKNYSFYGEFYVVKKVEEFSDLCYFVSEYGCSVFVFGFESSDARLKKDLISLFEPIACLFKPVVLDFKYLY
jgi:hypothetical protein